MLKYILLGIMVASVLSQRRPTYAGMSNRYPVVLPQYLNENQGTTPTSLANRIDDSASVSSGLSNSGPEINGDKTQIDWIKTWDQAKQPFWYLNWKHIQDHIGATQPAPEVDSGKPTFRSQHSLSL